MKNRIDIRTDVLDLEKVDHDQDQRISGKNYPLQKKTASKTAKPKTLGDLWRSEKQASRQEKPFQFNHSGPALKLKDAFKT